MKIHGLFKFNLNNRCLCIRANHYIDAIQRLEYDFSRSGPSCRIGRNLCGQQGHFMQKDGERPRFVHRYLASVLALASHRISEEFHKEVRKAGLTVTEWRVLGSLVEGEGETVGELAELAVTKQPTLSKVLP